MLLRSLTEEELFEKQVDPASLVRPLDHTQLFCAGC